MALFVTPRRALQRFSAAAAAAPALAPRAAHPSRGGGAHCNTREQPFSSAPPAAAAAAALPERVRIVEVGPRDGLQNEAQNVSTEIKVRPLAARRRAPRERREGEGGR